MINVNQEEFLQAYLTAALWSSVDGDTPLDENHCIDDIAPGTLEILKDKAIEFMNQNHVALLENGFSQAGHDFWLNCNGHGAGFWDGDWPINGDKLSLACDKIGETQLYIGDDQKIYC